MEEPSDEEKEAVSFKRKHAKPDTRSKFAKKYACSTLARRRAGVVAVLGAHQVGVALAWGLFRTALYSITFLSGYLRSGRSASLALRVFV